MREILFRGKKQAGKGWIYGNYSKTIFKNGNEIHCIQSIDSIECQGHEFHSNWIIDPETLGQYIGLKDVEDNKIFEGDIYYEPDRKCNVVIIFQDGCFLARDAHGKNGFISPSNEFKKLGNIHDNPELLQ